MKIDELNLHERSDGCLLSRNRELELSCFNGVLTSLSSSWLMNEILTQNHLIGRKITELELNRSSELNRSVKVSFLLLRSLHSLKNPQIQVQLAGSYFKRHTNTKVIQTSGFPQNQRQLLMSMKKGLLRGTHRSH
ncbi:hypothetical protein P8452_18381 [Trifolium repens]|nr:hypothetical protein P8452_18381 [Trifolium repens]